MFTFLRGNEKLLGQRISRMYIVNVWLGKSDQQLTNILHIMKLRVKLLSNKNTGCNIFVLKVFQKLGSNFIARRNLCLKVYIPYIVGVCAYVITSPLPDQQKTTYMQKTTGVLNIYCYKWIILKIQTTYNPQLLSYQYVLYELYERPKVLYLFKRLVFAI